MLYLVKCKKCKVAKRFYRMHDEKEKICLACKLEEDIEDRLRDRIKFTLMKQARAVTWRNRKCLSCDTLFESVDFTFKCPLCTEKDSNMHDWNGR